MSNSRKLILVEDHEDVRIVFELLLKELGYEVNSCRNGGEGIRALENSRPDVAMIDIELPDIDGIELVAKIRELEKLNPWQSPKTNPIIVVSVTGYADEDQKIRALSAGSDLHFVKPIDLEIVCQKIDALGGHSTKNSSSNST